MDPEDHPVEVLRDEIEEAFPRLEGQIWRLKSPKDRSYQCIAWAACRTDHIWWPYQDDPPPLGLYWPPGVPANCKVETFVQAFEPLGYRRCDSREFEFGYQKVAIYAWDVNTTTHMARQHFCGRGWLSKPGRLADIVHPTLESLESDPPYSGTDYGKIFQILKRSWVAALITDFGLFRCAWYAFRFWLYRVTHGW